MTDIWVFKECPAPLSGTHDDGNLPFHFEPPHGTNHAWSNRSDKPCTIAFSSHDGKF